MHSNLRVTQLVKKFRLLYNQEICHHVHTPWTLSWGRWIQFIFSNTILQISLVIQSFHLRLGLPSGLYPSAPTLNISYLFNISLKHATHPHQSHLPWFNHPNNIWWTVRSIKLLIMQVSPIFCLRSKVLLRTSLKLRTVNNFTVIFSIQLVR
jgi:hypothetical protein